MNALKATSLLRTAIIPIEGSNADSSHQPYYDTPYDDDDDFDGCSLDGFSLAGGSDDGKPRLMDETDNNNGNGIANQAGDARIIADQVQSFLQSYLPTDPNTEQQPLQPISVLQQYYNTIQYAQNKQAQMKSIKSWYTDKSWGELRDLHWTSRVSIPREVASEWGLIDANAASTGDVKEAVDISSGHLPLSLDVRERLSDLYAGDLLGDLFGKYKVSSITNDGNETVWFKTKNSSRKSATLNALFAMELGTISTFTTSSTASHTTLIDEANSMPIESDRSSMLPIKAKVCPGWVDRLYNLGFGSSTSNQQFKLQSMRYIGALKDQNGELLSSNNPCLVSCVATFLDSEADDSGEVLSVKSMCCRSKEDSLYSLLNQLEATLVSRRDINQQTHAMKSEKDFIQSSLAGVIEYEEILPRWSTSKMESTFFLYELDFHLKRDMRVGTGESNNRINEPMPIPEAFGLDDDVCTRIGIVIGSDLFESIDDINIDLCADFTLPSGTCFSVRMFNRRRLSLSDLMQQIVGVSPKIHLQSGEDPLTLMKCFNFILFEDGGKTYGLKPMGEWRETLSKSAAGSVNNGRTHLFVPLLSGPVRETSSIDSSDSIRLGLQIDWRVVWDTVHHKPTHVLRRVGIEDYLLTGISLRTIDSFSSVKRVPSSLLRNRCMTSIGLKNWAFVTKGGESNTFTSLSPLLPANAISNVPSFVKDKFYEYNQLSLAVATYADYYQVMRKAPLRFPEEMLLHTTRIWKHTEHDFTLVSRHYEGISKRRGPRNSVRDLIGEKGYLVPELTVLLPMPRDMMYLCHHDTKFISALERSHLLRRAALRLRSIQRATCQALHYELLVISDADAVRLLNLATSASGSSVNTSERLESLGDAVLLFFIVLNVFAAKSPASDEVEMVLDLFRSVITMQGRNKVLVRAGMRLGMHVLLNCKQKKLSDVFESILGAAYILDSTGCAAVGILNEVGSCFPELGMQQSSEDNWFTGRGPCIREGYPFHRHSEWEDDLRRMNDVLQREQRVNDILQSNLNGLCTLLLDKTESKHRAFVDELQTRQYASLLVRCSLFDDDITEHSGLKCLSILREKLYYVGNSALQLKLVEEIYHHHTEATSGDIHFMKVVMLSDDSMAYILVKNGLHKCLFDRCDDSVCEFQCHMKEAERHGEKFWNKHDGWTLPGGCEEYRRRVQLMSGSINDNKDSPQYVGLAAGRLWGRNAKVPKEITNELMFSMKSICGGLVLALGLNNAWQLLRSFFLELLALSPDEIRNAFSGISSLADVYNKGNR